MILQALRRESAADNDQLQTVLKRLARRGERLAELSSKVDRVEIDVAALEIEDASRHGELLTVPRKLAHMTPRWRTGHEGSASPADFVTEASFRVRQRRCCTAKIPVLADTRLRARASLPLAAAMLRSAAESRSPRDSDSF